MSLKLNKWIKAIKPIEPAFDKNNVSVVFAVDKNYLPYLHVCIYSLIKNSSSKYNYDICILHDGSVDFSKFDKEFLINSSSSSHPNINIKYVTIDLSGLDFDFSKYVHSHFNETTYYRFFIPYYFSKYEKILYLDVDLIILDDVAKLFKIDLKGAPIAGGSHYPIKYLGCVDDRLKMKMTEYFCAGVMIFNINMLLQDDFLKKSLMMVKNDNDPPLLFADQDILNILYKGKALFLPNEWHFLWQPFWHHFLIFNENQVRGKGFKSKLIERYKKASDKAKIIHYTSDIKPWNSPSIKFAEIWWSYAKETPFYCKLILLRFLPPSPDLVKKRAQLLILKTLYTILK